jgi:hypothetical protein
VTVIVTIVVDVGVLVKVTVAVGVGKDRQLHAVEISEHAKALSGGGAPPQFTAADVVVDFAVEMLGVVDEGFKVVVAGFDVAVDFPVAGFDVVVDLVVGFDVVVDFVATGFDAVVDFFVVAAFRRCGASYRNPSCNTLSCRFAAEGPQL